MIPVTLLFAALLIVFITAFFYLLCTRDRPLLRTRRGMAFVLLALAILIAAGYLLGVAAVYRHTMKKFKQVRITKNEPAFFAMQTALTIGYGIDCCNHCIYPNSAPLSAEEEYQLHEKLHQVATWSMIAWLPVWFFCVGTIVNFAGKLLLPIIVSGLENMVLEAVKQSTANIPTNSSQTLAFPPHQHPHEE